MTTHRYEVANLSAALRNGVPEVTLTGPAGSQYAIEQAPALTGPAAWQTLTNVVLVTGQVSFTERAFSANPSRFYRARLAR